MAKKGCDLMEPHAQIGPEPNAKAMKMVGARKSAPSRTLGPVPDLERHLPPDWWRTLFNSIYLKTDGDVVENDLNTSRDVDLLLRTTGIQPHEPILDVCCGQGRHCLELARQGFQRVSGIDRSRYLIRLARKRARQQGVPATFHEGDARKFRFPENSVRCVTLFGNSFGYFEREDDDRAVLERIKRVLCSGGVLAMDLVDGDWMRGRFDARSWEWIDEHYFVCRERSLTSDGSRLLSREVVVHAERGVIADQFYAERLYSREAIQTLLGDAGFERVRDHGAIETLSDRGQDLGMMAHRMFLTATAPRKAVSAAKRGPLYPEAMVLLGDPGHPDRVKLNGVFNDEDLTTIERMREALATLKEYRFEYFTDHASLIARLREHPPRFVFNLCDEGYRNNPFRELHIPALLDLLGISYTGAGPACLGLCYNKSVVRAVAASLDIPVPLETYFDPEDQAATLPSVFPALLKPNFGDGSVGITQRAVVHTKEELLSYLETLRDQFRGYPLLVQEFLPGAEYSVGIIGNPGLTYQILPVLEVDYSKLGEGLPPILGYESKWAPDSPYWDRISYRRATCNEDTRRKLRDHANLLFERLGCQDYARFDFRADHKGKIKLLEVNPNPGWCWDGKMNMMAGFEGMSYANLLRLILEAAQERISAEANL